MPSLNRILWLYERLKKEQLRLRSCLDKVLPRRGIMEGFLHSASRRQDISENFKKAADQKVEDSSRSLEVSFRS